MVVAASLADLLRLATLLAFAWAAYRDLRTRRLPNRLWPPLVAIGGIALALDAAALFPFDGIDGRVFLIRVAFSVGFLLPFSYLAFRLGAFGGADAKAVMTLAVVFPTTPTYAVALGVFPVEPGALGVTAMATLTNAVLVAAVYVVGLGAANALRGRLGLAAFLGRPLPVERLPETHGTLLSRDGLPSSELDLDALRMYLRWRGITLADLRREPDRYRDADSVGRTFDPTDGAVRAGPPVADGAGSNDHGVSAETPPSHEESADDEIDEDRESMDDEDRESMDDERDLPESSDAEMDPWAAAAFLSAIDGTAYGTTAAELRRGIERITTHETVWVSPGLPFVVPLFVGLVLAVTVGDLLTILLRGVV